MVFQQHVDSQPGNIQVEPTQDWMPFHSQSVEGCLLNLETTLQGLNSELAEARLKQLDAYGHAERAFSGTPREIFLHSLKKRVSWLFGGAALLSFYMAYYTGDVGRYGCEGLLILVAMLVNGGVQGLIQWKSLLDQKTVEMPDSIRCTVRRDGQVQNVNAGELVPGDILLVEGGQVIPADARLISSYQLQADESMLTGESVLVPKNANTILHPAEDVTAQCNMLFAGTTLKTGKGEAVVVALGEETVMGRIAVLAKTTQKRESSFTRRLNGLALRISIVAVLLAVLIIVVGYYRGLPVPQLIQVGLLLGIAAFPETIPGLASLILSLGVGRLNERKVLVKSFHALESVGDIMVICTDKTGTLTENYLTLERLCVPGLGVIPYEPQWQQGEGIPCKSVEEFLRVGRLNNGTMAEGFRSMLGGDPIDVAIYRAAPASLEAGYHQRMTLPFDPVTLRSATLCEAPDGRMISMIKGAPEAVMEVCQTFMQPDGSVAPMSLSQRSEFLMYNRKLAFEHNLRVIGFAQKLLADENDTDPYSNAVFLGWVCLLDPPKPGVVETVSALQQIGARVVMITGDQKPTAEMTARELGIMRRNSDEVWLRSDLEQEDGNIRDTVCVFARTKPEEKLLIVESLQRHGAVVAMVGDGVNDSPALQKSDVAIAMGLQGSEAAKESAEIILMNDRLDGILAAITESRLLRGKVQSCIRYLLSCNIGLMLFVAAAMVAGLGASLNVIQILWLNLVIATVPALVLAIEPVREEAMQRAASRTHDAHATDPLDSTHLVLIGFWAAVMVAAGLCSYFVTVLALKQPPAVGATAAFCAMGLAMTFNLFNVQALNAGENRSSFLSELSSTPITWIVVAVGLVLQALTIYAPVLNTVMGTVPMPLLVAPIPVAFGLGAVMFSLKTMKV